MNDILKAAHEYASMGWHIFPVVGKRPALDRVKRWSVESTTDPEVIERWFADSEGHGIGLDLAKSKLVAVDGDNLDRVPAELLELLEASDAWLHRGNPERKTFLFSENGHRIPQAVHGWGEVKAAGGYIVLAPSPHNVGGQYVWLERPETGAPPVMPEGIEKLIAPIVKDAPEGIEWDGEPASEEEVGQAEHTFRRLIGNLAGAVENRNILLNTTALILGHYVPHILDEKTVRDALEDACDKNGLVFDDGLPSVRDTIDSGLRKGKAEPQRPEVIGIDEDEILADVEPPVKVAGSWLDNQITAESWADRRPPTPPTVLAIEGTDGALFAKGRISRLFGLSGSAKSWAAKAATEEVLRAGGSAIYLDADGIYEDFRDHMTLLGLSLEDATSGRLHYCRVEGALGDKEYRKLMSSRQWDLVIVDGLNACLSMGATRGRSGHDAPDVDSFFANVLHPAANTGAAVVVVDHMRKDGETDHGSVQKRNNLTGTDYAIKRKVPIAPGVLGYAEIRLTHKDRSGWATSVHAKRGKDAGEAFAYLTVDSTEEGATRVTVKLDLPSGIRATAGTQSVQSDADTLLKLLHEVNEFSSNANVRSALKERSKDMDNSRINEAADYLSTMGLVERFAGSRGALGLRLLPASGQVGDDLA